jgi:hypothetical protein
MRWGRERIKEQNLRYNNTNYPIRTIDRKQVCVVEGVSRASRSHETITKDVTCHVFGDLKSLERK